MSKHIFKQKNIISLVFFAVFLAAATSGYAASTLHSILTYVKDAKNSVKSSANTLKTIGTATTDIYNSMFGPPTESAKLQAIATSASLQNETLSKQSIFNMIMEVRDATLNNTGDDTSKQLQLYAMQSTYNDCADAKAPDSDKDCKNPIYTTVSGVKEPVILSTSDTSLWDFFDCFCTPMEQQAAQAYIVNMYLSNNSGGVGVTKDSKDVTPEQLSANTSQFSLQDTTTQLLNTYVTKLADKLPIDSSSTGYKDTFSAVQQAVGLQDFYEGRTTCICPNVINQAVQKINAIDAAEHAADNFVLKCVKATENAMNVVPTLINDIPELFQDIVDSVDAGVKLGTSAANAIASLNNITLSQPSNPKAAS
jgi:hypothetical protein